MRRMKTGAQEPRATPASALDLRACLQFAAESLKLKSKHLVLA